MKKQKMKKQKQKQDKRNSRGQKDLATGIPFFVLLLLLKLTF